MKITKHYSLKAADKVLTKVRALVADCDGKDVYIGAWSNGREQGYCLSADGLVRGKNVLFAQQRNSDHILVIVDRHKPFDFCTNHPCEEDFNEGKEFANADAAAEYISMILAAKNHYFITLETVNGKRYFKRMHHGMSELVVNRNQAMAFDSFEEARDYSVSTARMHLARVEEWTNS